MIAERIGALLAAWERGIITDDEAQAELVIIRHRRQIMGEFSELLDAARKRACPHCSGGLTVRHNGAHYVLACTKCNSQMGSPDDCPGQATLRILENDMMLARAGHSVGQRSVADDMADLYD